MRRLISVVIVAAFLQIAGLAVAGGVKPEACSLDEKCLLGLYTGNGEQILVREDGGMLQLLYRYLPEDRDFRKSNIFPLQKKHYDSYLLREAGALTDTEGTVKFERDKDGHGISCSIGVNRYTRKFFGPEKGDYFKIKPPKSWAELQTGVASALMPVQTAPQKAVLVDLSAVQGLMLDLRYATENNCFSYPLYSEANAYLDKSAAGALARVAENLASYGYGLLVWDAYRPWHLSKLAYDALPPEQKYLLPEPQKGSPHNTGRAVDLSLYELETGKPVNMISEFDEPSLRQYGRYAGGTSLERWQRNLLWQLMSLEGFNCSETEWWHFEYGNVKDYRLLDIPLSDLGQAKALSNLASM